MAASILSDRVDGMNCHYGWLGNRRIDVMRTFWLTKPVEFTAYVDGEPIGGKTCNFDTLQEAEAAAIKWAQENEEKCRKRLQPSSMARAPKLNS